MWKKLKHLFCNLDFTEIILYVLLFVLVFIAVRYGLILIVTLCSM